MKRAILQYVFKEIDSKDAINELANAFESEVSYNTSAIPAPHGQGLIRRFELEEGLSMRVWELELNKPLVFRKVIDETSSEKIFHIVWALNPAAIQVWINDQLQSSGFSDGMNILLLSTDVDGRMEIRTTERFFAIDISFTASWLQNSFIDAGEEMTGFIKWLLANPEPVLLFDCTTATEYRTLAYLHNSALEVIYDSLLLRAHALSLLSGFFTHVCRRSISIKPECDLFYFQKMVEVEKLLAEHLEKNLPSIETIAKTVALSESSLKRYFKLMFGRSIYEYYLELKMDFAKRLLLEKSLTVNEVAATLCYERVSSFIDTFKRFHGVPPGVLRKKAS